MNRNTSTALLSALFLAWSSVTYSAPIVYSEAVNGQLDFYNTSPFTLGVGINTFSGTCCFDAIPFTVPSQTVLNNISATFDYSLGGNIRSLGLALVPGATAALLTSAGPKTYDSLHRSESPSTKTIFSQSTPLAAGTYNLSFSSISLDWLSPSPLPQGSVTYSLAFNVQSIALPPPPTSVHSPINYGLFVGAKDSIGEDNHHSTILSDQNARDMASAFSTRLNSQAYILTGDLTLDGNGNPISPITKDQLSNALTAIRSKMQTGDTFTLYINGHGGSISTTKNPDGTFTSTTYNETGIGTDVIHIGDYLSDVDLTLMLMEFDGFRKAVFLDACHGGGFWGGSDSMEYPLNGGQGFNQLNQLSDIALYSGASEDHKEHAGTLLQNIIPFSEIGLSFWGEALEEALRTPVTWTAAGLGDFLNTRTLELADPLRLNYPLYYTLGLGDIVPADPSLIQTYHIYSTDFDANSSLFESVPEPNALALLGLGLGGLGFARRKKVKAMTETTQT